MGWKIYDEAIEMVERRYRYFPSVFCWRGRRYEVEATDRCWTVVRQGWQRRAERQYFQVRCSGGQFELFQDLKEGTWHLRRAKIAPQAVPTVQRLASAWR